VGEFPHLGRYPYLFVWVCVTRSLMQQFGPCGVAWANCSGPRA